MAVSMDLIRGTRHRASLEFRPSVLIVLPGAAFDPKSEYFMEYNRCAAERCKLSWAFQCRLLVRKLLFSFVYYNNGNSLVFFSIRTCWGYGNQVGNVSSSLSLSTTQFGAVNRIFFGVCVLCASLAQCRFFPQPHWLSAGNFESPSLDKYRMVNCAVTC